MQDAKTPGFSGVFFFICAVKHYIHSPSALDTMVIRLGKYTYLAAKTRLEVFDMPTFLSLNGQELLSADNAGVKISLAVTYKVTDPRALLSGYENYHEYLYSTSQFKLIEVVSSLVMDDILTKRQDINNSGRFVNK